MPAAAGPCRAARRATGSILPLRDGGRGAASASRTARTSAQRVFMPGRRRRGRRRGDHGRCSWAGAVEQAAGARRRLPVDAAVDCTLALAAVRRLIDRARCARQTQSMLPRAIRSSVEKHPMRAMHCWLCPWSRRCEQRWIIVRLDRTPNLRSDRSPCHAVTRTGLPERSLHRRGHRTRVSVPPAASSASRKL